MAEGNSTDVKFGNLEAVLAEPDTAMRIFGKGEIKGHRRVGVLLARRESVQESLDCVFAMREKVEIEM